MEELNDDYCARPSDTATPNATKDCGGPAFPERHGPEHCVSGMTLRDYIATAAIASLIMACDKFGDVTDNKTAAQKAYQIADAMIAERERSL